jgi:hypothetical protein
MIAMPYYRALCVVQVGKGTREATEVYHARLDRLWVPTRPGDASGGDATRMPVEGLTIGMALRCRDGAGA